MSNYNYKNIKILKGLEAVKKRPGMYIGNTEDGTGFHHMVFEVIDNSIDEHISNYCNILEIIIYKDNSISIEDDGRGIPIEINKEYNKSCAELVMTVLHAGGKFDNDAYKISGGLHGVGISVVNALSKKLELIININNKSYIQVYKYGQPLEDIKILDINSNKKNGTFIKFYPNLDIFEKNNTFKYDIIYEKLNELSYLNPKLLIKLEDRRTDKLNIIQNKNGLESFIKDLTNNEKIIHQKIFYTKNNYKKIDLELAICWTNNIKEKFYCFTNNIKQKYGGSHLSALKLSITKSINFYIKEINKKIKFNIIGEDTREGIVSIISIKIPNPKFSSQTKDKLISSEIKNDLDKIIYEKLTEFLLENQDDSKLIINKIIQSSINRESIKKSKEIIRKKNQLDLSNLIGKLSDCQEKNPILSELYLVEGDSAGGSAKQARNRKYQAVLSLKGKIINVEKSSLEKVFLSKEILSLIISIGCGTNKDNFNINKLRYHKIIIMTDADIDGAHIRTLLLTFFLRYIPELIFKGHIYIVNSPLYKISKKKYNKYLNNKLELYEYKTKFIIKNINLYIKIKEKYNNNIKVLILKYLNFLNYYKKKNIIYILLYNFIINKNINFEMFKNIYYNDIFEDLENLINYINEKNINYIKIKYDFYNYKESKILNIKEFKYGIYINNEININKFILSNKYNDIIFLKKELYILSENISFLDININNKNNIKNFLKIIDKLILESLKGLIISRYKGLGEMNPDQLWDTTMNPKNRILLKVIINNIDNTNRLFNILMGESVIYRKEFIEKNYKNVNKLDI